ncbi:uncharacterized protein A4U43_C05F22980 [Asparagus officinalis]|uniref:Uncharacterized protein n=1 Tax=Asparagus officinalis TaxID=4686 RepID=A0A5P1EWA5_ASPOF|nr:uncharacterized protein A4U43_C05F22980 [Asparagus officinalis]
MRYGLDATPGWSPFFRQSLEEGVRGQEEERAGGEKNRDGSADDDEDAGGWEEEPAWAGRRGAWDGCMLTEGGGGRTGGLNGIGEVANEMRNEDRSDRLCGVRCRLDYVYVWTRSRFGGRRGQRRSPEKWRAEENGSRALEAKRSGRGNINKRRMISFA